MNDHTSQRDLARPHPQGRQATAGKNKKKRESALDRAKDNERLIGQNRKARHDFEVLETLECGLVLVGSEVKSLRNGSLSLDESYARVRDGEVWLIGCDIPEYTFSHRMNHDPRRPRKLLLHRREIRKFANRAHEQGCTLVPLKMYFKQGRAKLLLGLCRGRKKYDKREAMKKADMRRDIDRVMRRTSRG
ncbi:MAG: SsrA-binding protein SmpB [Pirellulales bacterium]